MIREVIQKEMTHRGIKKSNLSDSTGISRNQISGFFKGKSLSIPNIEKICDYLNLVLIKKF